MLAPGQGQRYCVGHRGAHVPDDGVAQPIELVRPVMAAVLYPCSAEADVIDPDRRQAR